MDALAIMAKICGVVLFVWTAHSIFKHFSHRSISDILCPRSSKTGSISQAKPSPAAKNGKKGSVTEHLLNNLLLYLWFIFLLAFSIGLIINN
jgi:hypothetical protein